MQNYVLPAVISINILILYEIELCKEIEIAQQMIESVNVYTIEKSS